MTDDPYAKYRDDELPTNLMQVLTQLADEFQEAESAVEEAEKEYERRKDILKDYVENKIPTAAEGLEGKFKLTDGRTLEIKEDIRASIAGEKKVPAIKWLDDHDYGHIVKRQVVIEFGKDSEDEVKALLSTLGQHQAQTGERLNIKDKFDVHHMTLTSWVKERLSEGEDLPKETFGIYHQKTAKVKE